MGLMTEILFFLVRNPGGKRTPQDSIHRTPNLKRTEEIEPSLESAAVHQSQSALRDFVRFDRLLLQLTFDSEHCRSCFGTGAVALSPVPHLLVMGLYTPAAHTLSHSPFVRRCKQFPNDIILSIDAYFRHKFIKRLRPLLAKH